MERIRLEELIDAKQLERHMPQLQGYFEKGGTWQELAGFSHDQLEDHYKVGHEHYLAARYAEASEAFLALTILNPYDMRYWFALGAASFEQGEFEDAAAAYLTSHGASEGDYAPLLHAARSYLRLGDIEMGRELLRNVQQQAPQAHLQQRARDLLDGMD